MIVDQAKHKIMNEYLGIRIVSPDIFFSSLKNNNYVVLVTVRNAVKFDPQILRSEKVSFFYFDQVYLQSNCEAAKEIVELLEDDTSKLIFSSLIGNRMLLRDRVPTTIIDSDQYFCFPEFARRRNQFLIDCGAYVGDTFEKWLENNEGNISAYLGIDPIRMHAEKFFNRFKRLSAEYDLSAANVEFITKLVADRRGSIALSGEFGSATSRLNMQLDLIEGMPKETTETIEVTTIDEEVRRMIKKAPQTQSIFIKMDIEGGEFDALNGAMDTLKNFRPLLAISIYHRIDDYIRIPNFLKDNLDSYKFFIRHHSPLADETVLYCSPKE